MMRCSRSNCARCSVTLGRAPTRSAMSWWLNDAFRSAPRLFDSEIGSQFKQRNGNAFMKIEVQETGAAQQQPVALLQIVLMKCLEGRFGAMCRDTFESAPAETADSAIIVSLAPKTEAAEWQQRKLGDRTRRKQGDGHPLAAISRMPRVRNSAFGAVAPLSSVARSAAVITRLRRVSVATVAPP